MASLSRRRTAGQRRERDAPDHSSTFLYRQAQSNFQIKSTEKMRCAILIACFLAVAFCRAFAEVETNFDDFWEQLLPPEPVDEDPNLESCRKYHPNARRTIVVSAGQSARDLQTALDDATPGTLVVVGKGTWATNETLTRTFEVKNKGASRSSPITICGPGAKLDGNRRHAGLLLHKSRFVTVTGLTVQNAAKGIKMWSVSDCTLDGVTVDGTNVEAVHIQFSSHRNTVRNCKIRNTGRTIPNVGEGIYLGSSRRNKKGDVCVGNRILDNVIGPGVTAEPIDVKEYTRDGVIAGNTLDGRDLCSKCPDPVSLVNVKGRGYRIERNIGLNALEYAFKESAVATAPRPKGNVFRGNKCLTKSRSRGYPCVKG